MSGWCPSPHQHTAIKLLFNIHLKTTTSIESCQNVLVITVNIVKEDHPLCVLESGLCGEVAFVHRYRIYLTMPNLEVFFNFLYSGLCYEVKTVWRSLFAGFTVVEYIAKLSINPTLERDKTLL